MATNGTDFLNFFGAVQQITVTLTNPYSSKSFDIDDEFNVNNSTYDGLGGVDTLLMTSLGDWISLTNDIGMQVIRNVESFQAGSGGDVINLAHEEIVYNDVTIAGGQGNDILWANIGNDVIFGSGGDDIIDGGPGNDQLFGNADNDQIFGGAGNDLINGGDGDDILYGGTDLGLRELDKDFIDNVMFPNLIEGVDIQNLAESGTVALGINADNLTVDFGATATLTFRDGFAGYNNTLGVYAIAEDGTIQSAEILWGNVKTAGIDVDHQITLPVGEEGGQFGFFIIADGARVNNYSGLDITGDGVISFIYDFGGAGERAATVNDDGNLVSIVYDDGSTVRELNGYHYHTTPRGDLPNINWDHNTHALSGLPSLADPNLLRIGFEDLPNLGDADFEDVLFDLDINKVHIDASEPGNDTLIGGAGNDILYGEAGNDLLFIGQGLDQIYGGSGVDQIIYNFMDSAVDEIFGFEAGIGGDVLNISNILQGYDPIADALSDFVRLVNSSGDTQIQINADGDIGGAFTAIAVFAGGIAATLADLITNGNLVADQVIATP